MNAFDGQTGAQLQKALMAGAWLLTVLIAIGILWAALSLRYLGTGVAATNTISVSGTGDVYATPDVGDFTYSVVSDKTTVAAAQQDATVKGNAVSAYLKSAGVDEKDIKTVGYSISPQYEYRAAASCPIGTSAAGGPAFCPPGRQVLKGYEVRQTNEVKVRDTAKAGDLLAGVGGKGATEVSGLSFTIEDPNAVEAQARDKAIADAKEKAKALAQELGVSLARIVSFSENQGGAPQPLYGFEAALGKGAGTAAVSPEIQTGQNKYTSNVSITYEIR